MSLWCENRDRGPQMTNSSRASSRASKTGEDLEAFLHSLCNLTISSSLIYILLFTDAELMPPIKGQEITTMPGEKSEQTQAKSEIERRERMNGRKMYVVMETWFCVSRAIHHSTKQRSPVSTDTKQGLPTYIFVQHSQRTLSLFCLAIFLSISHGFEQERAKNKRGRVTESYRLWCWTG